MRIDMLVFYWLINVPIFVMIILEKCIDFSSYRSLGMTGKTAKRVLVNLISVELAHILLTISEYLILYKQFVSVFSLIVVIPLFSVLPLVVIYLYERKIFQEPNYKSYIIASHDFNLILTLIFDLLYSALTAWIILPVEIEILGSQDKNPNNELIVVGSVLLLAAFTYIKFKKRKGIEQG